MKIAKRYYSENFRLALPIILSLTGQTLVQMVDNIMVGRLGASQLAAVSFAGAVIMVILVVGMGVAVGLTPFAGASYARGDYRDASSLFQNSLVLNTVIGVLLTGLLFAVIPLFPHLGQQPDVLAHTYGYYMYVSISVLPYMIFLSFKQFMEAVGNTSAAMIITIVCNLLNVLFNYLFIYGKMGCLEMGAAGAGFATMLSRLLMPVMFFAYVYRTYPYRRFLKFFNRTRTSLRRQIELLRVGLPISGQMTLEFFSLSVITIMMGWISTDAQAANQIVMSLVAFTFMMTNGIAGASTILVSHAYGMRNMGDIRRYAYSGFRLSVVIMVCAAILFVIFGRSIASWFTTDEAVIDIAQKLFYVVGLFEIFDGLQVTALGALRGVREVSRPMGYALIAFLVVSVPGSYLLGIVLGLGPVGLLSGFMLGLITACILYIRRFNVFTRRNIRSL